MWLFFVMGVIIPIEIFIMLACAGCSVETNDTVIIQNCTVTLDAELK